MEELKEFSTEKLKSLAYDSIQKIEIYTRNLQILNSEIARREKETQEKTEHITKN